jgi:hypothetical protein
MAADAARIAWLAARQQWANAQVALWSTKRTMELIRMQHHAEHFEKMQTIDATKLRELSAVLSQTKKDLRIALSTLHAARLRLSRTTGTSR